MGKISKTLKTAAAGDKRIPPKKTDGNIIKKKKKTTTNKETKSAATRGGMMKSLKSVSDAEVCSVTLPLAKKKGGKMVKVPKAIKSVPVSDKKIKAQKPDISVPKKKIDVETKPVGARGNLVKISKVVLNKTDGKTLKKKIGEESKLSGTRGSLMKSLNSISDAESSVTPSLAKKKTVKKGKISKTVKIAPASDEQISKMVKIASAGDKQISKKVRRKVAPVGDKKIKLKKDGGVLEKKSIEKSVAVVKRGGSKKNLKTVAVTEQSVAPSLPKKNVAKDSTHAKKRKSEVLREGAPETEQEESKTEKSELDGEQVSQGVKAVLVLAKQDAESKKDLFDGEHQPIFLQVTCVKVPKVPTRQLRLLLPHTLVTDTDDVALFVKDLQKGRGKDYEPTVNHYQDLLRKYGCTQIKDVIPMTQVKTEYDQYELKRKLLSSYDYFLTDGVIAGHLSHLLGKTFISKRKLPTSIRMESTDLKREIDFALRKTCMQLHSHGNTHIVQVGHTSMTKAKILQNVLSVCNDLNTKYPGGWDNIRSLILKTTQSLPVPIYITLKSKSQVKVAVVAPKRPKAHRPQKGELSTVSGDAEVVVMPDGRVTLNRTSRKGKEEDDDEPTNKKRKLHEGEDEDELSDSESESLTAEI